MASVTSARTRKREIEFFRAVSDHKIGPDELVCTVRAGLGTPEVHPVVCVMITCHLFLLESYALVRF